MSGRTVVGQASVPRLPRGVRLKYDKPRDRWVVLAPERLFALDAIALAIVRGCDGKSSVAGIVDGLAEAYGTPREVILRDVIQLLQDFADKGVVAA